MPWHVVHGSIRHLSCVHFLLQFVPRAATVKTAQSRVDTASTTLPVTSSVERVTTVTQAFSRHCAKQVICHYAGLILSVYVARYSSVYVFGTAFSALVHCPLKSSL